MINVEAEGQKYAMAGPIARRILIIPIADEKYRIYSINTKP
ncbi:hypothetical protein DSUL_50309 [Desulfovibrionales bacterium]